MKTVIWRGPVPRGGRFVDTGTPDELLARPSLFKQLLESFEPDAKPGQKPA